MATAPATRQIAGQQIPGDTDLPTGAVGDLLLAFVGDQVRSQVALAIASG
jgi:hypothetical protein